MSSHDPDVADASFAIVPFSYASPFSDALKLDERLFDVGLGRTLAIRQAWKPDGKGGSALGFGASVYDCAFILAEYVCRNRKSLIDGNVVVELGAGLGLTSIAASLSGAAGVWATDGDAELLDLTMDNMKRNAAEQVNAGALRVSPLFWGNEAHMGRLKDDLAASAATTGRPAGRPLCDVVLAADVAACVYEDAFPALHATLCWLCDDCGASTVIIAYRRRFHAEDAFFTLASGSFDIEDIPHSELHVDFQSDAGVRVMRMARKRVHV